MPNLNYTDSFYIGTEDGKAGILLNDQANIISYTGGLINTGSSIYPIRSLSSGTITLLSTDMILILLLKPSISLTINLGTHPDGKIFYFRRADINYASVCTIQRSGSDVIRFTSGSSVNSFIVSGDQSFILVKKGGIWWNTY